MAATEDQTISCVDCGRSFTWSAREQDFYAEKGFSAPKRCKACKEAKKAQRNAGGGEFSGGMGNR